MVGVESQPSAEAAWVDIGVDDLTKYRVVEYLYLHLGEGAEMGSLASALGFRSSEQTTSTLEELAQRGVIWIEQPPVGPARCGLARDPLLRCRVGRLLALNDTREHAASLMERLARRSLARVRARLQGRD